MFWLDLILKEVDNLDPEQGEMKTKGRKMTSKWVFLSHRF